MQGKLAQAKAAAIIAAAELKEQLAAEAAERRISEMPAALLDARAELEARGSVLAGQEAALAEMLRIDQHKQALLRRRVADEKRQKSAKAQMAGAVEAFLKHSVYRGYRGKANTLVAKCEQMVDYQGLDPLLLLFEGLGGLAEQEARDSCAKEERAKWVAVADRRREREDLADARRSFEVRS